MICQGCGGVLGRDCYNQYDCMQISRSMELQGYVEPYMEALQKAKDAIEWMSDNMTVDNPHMQEHFINLSDNTVALLRAILPPPPRTAEQIQADWDDLPF